ncbi:hypothetical protein Golob_017161 [Gossypium lobatum]|uniref:U1 small nuclear ribonucleoprotein C n=1 Tax=Gossypium lobatum TaxID=34289 RepID=A0A7J8M6J4_9ROSI|nr:hypothetical protein [Gossypium lobatum]
MNMFIWIEICRYYCDYCDTYLTHDSKKLLILFLWASKFQPSVRKQHNAGYKHKANVRTYYQQFEEQQTQSLIDQRIKEHLGQAAAFHQVGAAFNQHLMAQRPRLPVLPTPVMPIPRGAPLPINQPMVPGIRPPVLPRPVPGAPGYVPVPGMPPTVAPPGAPSFPGQINGLPQPPTLAPPSTVPVTATTPTSSNAAPTMATPALYQSNPAAPASGGFDNFNANAQPSEANQ